MHSDRNAGGRRLASLAGPLLACALLAACSSGPTDFVDLATLNVETTGPSQVRSPASRAALTKDLTATGDRVAARGAAADNGLPSAMALALIRQQQNEDARALLAEANGRTVAPALPPCPDERPPEADGTCVRP